MSTNTLRETRWGFGAEFEEAGLFLAGFSSGGEEFEDVFRGRLRRAWDELDEEELEGVERSEVVEVEVVLETEDVYESGEGGVRPSGAALGRGNGAHSLLRGLLLPGES